MFTGIIEELGQIKSIEWKTEGARFYITAKEILEDGKKGDSICVNGCCLTIIEIHPCEWSCDVVRETLNCTTFRNLREGDPVNLERAIKLQDRLGGHLVQGHVDEVGMITQKKALDDGSWWMTIKTPPPLLRYMVYKGSIAIDGVSLTIAAIADNQFSFAMIPHTAALTTLGSKQPGEWVNLEVDLMAKYVERLLRPLHKSIG
jgi:riboflavin synthase